jgi:hypothetical protein
MSVTPMMMLSATSLGSVPAFLDALYVSHANAASPWRAHDDKSSRHVVSSGTWPRAFIASTASNVRFKSPPRPEAYTSALNIGLVGSISAASASS